MQFKHPEILYALFLLIIPILIHLFQLRRFQKVAFTNIKFLKEVALQTRKSSRLKKFLILCSRLLLFAMLILAFAQPFLSNTKSNTPTKTHIYLDNSFSMQAKGKEGELLKRAIQNIIEGTSSQENINLYTNNKIYENLSSKDLKNTLLSLAYDPIKSNLKSILLKIDNNILSNKNNKIKTLNNIILISDFQNINTNNKIKIDSLNHYFITQLAPLKKSNISVDSVYISEQNNESIQLTSIIKKVSGSEENISITLYNENILTGKSSINLAGNSSEKVQFNIPASSNFSGKIKIEDNLLNFDNELYFLIEKPKKINVTAIGNNNDYLSKIYTNDEFNYASTTLSNLDYNILNHQHLLILNEIEHVPPTFGSTLSDFTKKGGSLVIIPPKNANINTYNTLLKNLKLGSISTVANTELSATTINFSHPLLKGVFEKQIKNFQYPTVKSSFLSVFNNASSILSFENGKSFISQIPVENGKVYWLSASIDSQNSNFKNSPLIVPIFYNFGLYSYQPNRLYYTIGNTNNIDVPVQLKKDEVLHVTNVNEDYIPMQQIAANKVTITTDANPNHSGFVQVVNNKHIVKNLAYNYNRKESDLSYINGKTYFNNTSNISYTNNVSEAFTALSDKYKTTDLWQWFILLALSFLIIEILLLKFLKS